MFEMLSCAVLSASEKLLWLAAIPFVKKTPPVDRLAALILRFGSQSSVGDGHFLPSFGGSHCSADKAKAK